MGQNSRTPAKSGAKRLVVRQRRT
uniref:Uncharacterized protein n=1 Tax=Anguilla anguilla TaxID=7936 RepID=A0A0E9UVU8_ANGAN